MSLPRSRSHNVPTNPRNKPQTIPKQKQNSRSKGLSNSVQAQVNGLRWPGGLSPWGRWTVRGGRSEKANRTSGSTPWKTYGLHLVLGRSASNSCRADGPRRLGGRSAKPLPAKNSWPNGSKRKRSRTRDEHEEQLAELFLADSPHGDRGRSARHADRKPSLASWRSNLPPLCPISQINQGKATKS
jgi:hypothetical protein